MVICCLPGLAETGARSQQASYRTSASPEISYPGSSMTNPHSCTSQPRTPTLHSTPFSLIPFNMDTATLFDVKVHFPSSISRIKLTPPQDKVVLVTGGAKGIGRMISEGFVANGAKVYISSRDAKACEEACKELNALGKSPALYQPRHTTPLSCELYILWCLCADGRL